MSMVCEVGELGIGHDDELVQIRIRYAVDIRYAYGIPLHHLHVLCLHLFCLTLQVFHLARIMTKLA